MSDNYVAWIKWNGYTWVVCNSNDEGAFKVCRESEIADLTGKLTAMTERAERVENENQRLTSWLLRIDGGDYPCTDETQLRQWAYEAVVLKTDWRDD